MKAKITVTIEIEHMDLADRRQVRSVNRFLDVFGIADKGLQTSDPQRMPVEIKANEPSARPEPTRQIDSVVPIAAEARLERKMRAKVAPTLAALEAAGSNTTECAIALRISRQAVYQRLRYFEKRGWISRNGGVSWRNVSVCS